MFGALLGEAILTSVVGIGVIDEHNFTVPAVLVSAIGALLLWGTVHSVRTGRIAHFHPPTADLTK